MRTIRKRPHEDFDWQVIASAVEVNVSCEDEEDVVRSSGFESGLLHLDSGKNCSI